MLTDPIADMFTRVRNALMVGHAEVAMPTSNVKLAIAGVLKSEGYIEDFVVSEGPKPTLTLGLKYYGRRRLRKPVITGIKRVSKPGRRIYVGKGEIPYVHSGMGIAILSTPQGIMTGVQARRAGTGGEVLGYVW